MAETQEELIVLPVMVTDEEVFESEDLYDPFYDLNIKKMPVMIKKVGEEAEGKEGEATEEEKTEGFKILSAEEKEAAAAAKEAKEVQKAEDQSLSLTVETMTPEEQRKAREKFRVSYQTPFDPTKHQKPTNVVTPEDYIKMMTGDDTSKLPSVAERTPSPMASSPAEGGSGKLSETPTTPWSPKKPAEGESGKLSETPAAPTPWSPAKPVAGVPFTPARPGSRDDYMPDWAQSWNPADSTDLSRMTSSSDTGKLSAPGKADMDDIYKQRHFVPGEKRKPQSLDETKVPDQYRQRHKLEYGSKAQKIKDENAIPEQYRSGKIKPVGELPDQPKAEKDDTGSLKKE
jgi:hypothetical protein